MHWLVNLWFVIIYIYIYILHVLVMIYDLWYMVWVGTLNVKKQKKIRLFLVTLPCAMGLAHGKVCTIRRVPGGGTRRTDHHLPCAAGTGTRRTHYLRRVPEIVAHGEFIPTPSGSGPAVFLLFCAVYLDKYTAKFFAVCPKFGTRQTQPLSCL